MKKVIFTIALFLVSWAANAVQVVLVAHNQTSAFGDISTLITDGSHVSGIAGATTATWDWDGTTLTSTGLYSTLVSIGGHPALPALFSDQITNLSIDTSSSTASATAYSCVEGNFGPNVGANICGQYNFGTNYTDESTTIWGPGTAVSQTLGGDDMTIFGGPRSVSAYDFGSVSITEEGALLTIGNGIALGSSGGETMTFSIPVPNVSITIAGGNSQECSETNGSTIDFSTDINIPAGDAIVSVEWFLDTASIGFGESLSAFVPLGSHTIDVQVTTVLGYTTLASESIEVADTAPPDIKASFTDSIGNSINKIDRLGHHQIQVNYEVTDVCDPDPTVIAINGIDVNDGDRLSVQANVGQAVLDANNLTLHVTATDKSGNVAEHEEVLTIKD